PLTAYTLTGAGELTCTVTFWSAGGPSMILALGVLGSTVTVSSRSSRGPLGQPAVTSRAAASTQTAQRESRRITRSSWLGYFRSVGAGVLPAPAGRPSASM